MFGFGQGNGGITKAHLVNKSKVDGFLKSQGINIKNCDSTNYEDMSVETLTEVKEHIEDILAEKELNDVNVDQCDISCEAK